MEVESSSELSEWEIKEQERLARADRRKNRSVVSVPCDGVNEHLQHEHLWFNDGNVIIAAQNIRFKLYRGILAMYSSVFHDMFEVADASAGETVQGCPVISLTDNPEHLVLFLTLLYDGARHPFFVNPLYYMDFRDFRGIALLSLKYDVQHIQMEVIRRLRVCYPTTLAEWDIRYPKSCSAEPNDPKCENTLNVLPIDSIAVINLARRYNLADILPTVFFVCSMQASEDIIARVHYGDDGVEDVEELSREDLARCLGGRDACTKLELIYTPAQFRQFHDAVDCTHQSSCAKAWTSACGAFMDHPVARSHDLLYDILPWIDEQLGEYPMCSSCSTELKSLHTFSRRHTIATYFKDIFSIA